MIELTVKQFMDGRLSAPSFFEMPDPHPDSFIVIEKTSSAQKNLINSATLAFQSYAPSLFKAAELNEQVKQAVESLISLDAIGSVHLNSDYNFTDATTKMYRYQAVYDIGYY